MLAGTDVASAVGCHVEEIHVSDSDQKSQSGDCKQSEEDAKRLEMEAKIAPFRKLHSDVVERLTSLCQQWEQRPTTSTIPEDHQEEGEAILWHYLMGRAIMYMYMYIPSTCTCHLLLAPLTCTSTSTCTGSIMVNYFLNLTWVS